MTRFPLKTSILLMAVATSLSSTALGVTDLSGRVFVIPGTAQKEINERRPTGTLEPGALGLTGELTSREIAELLQQYGMNPFVKVVAEKPRGLGLKALAPAATDRRVTFQLGDFPLCQGSIRWHQGRGHNLVLGRIPQVLDRAPPTAADFPDLSRLADVILAEFHYQNLADELRDTVAAERCVWVETDGEPRPSWRLTVETAAAMPYTVIADDTKVYKIAPLYFAAVGKTKIFDKNAADGTLSFSALDELDGTGFLESPYFDTDTNSVDRAYQCDHNFLYDATDDRFPEASVFTHSTRTFDWYRSSFAFEWEGNPLRLIINDKVDNTDNNALYKPGAANIQNIPTIAVGTGDGTILQNLLTDGDVVSHEFGHHVVYRVVTETTGESRTVHEALADYFTFARTGDACLGESICPAGSRACFVPDTCLRSAENTLTFADAQVRQWPEHQQSQVLSGLLWDLTAKYSVPRENVLALTYGAVNLLNPETSLSEFTTALFSAEQTLFSQQYCTFLRAAAVERGLLAEDSTTVTCPAAATSLTLTSGLQLLQDVAESLILAQGTDESALAGVEATLIDCAPNSPSQKVSSKSEDKDWYQCGVLPQDSNPRGHGIWLLAILLALPILVIWHHRHQQNRTI